jgi:hypothetical protein
MARAQRISVCLAVADFKPENVLIGDDGRAMPAGF